MYISFYDFANIICSMFRLGFRIVTLSWPLIWAILSQFLLQYRFVRNLDVSGIYFSFSKIYHICRANLLFSIYVKQYMQWVDICSKQ